MSPGIFVIIREYMAVWVAERMAFVIIIIYQRCLYMFIANITIVALHYGKLWMKLHTNIQIMTNRTKCGYLLFYKNRRTAGMIARLFPAVLDFELDRQPDMIFCNKCREIVGHTRQFFRLPETKTRRIGVGGERSFAPTTLYVRKRWRRCSLWNSNQEVQAA